MLLGMRRVYRDVSEDSSVVWVAGLAGLGERLEKVLPERWASVEILPLVDSTNRYLLERRDLVPDRYHVCVAREQTAGRGRRGRAWKSSPEHGLTFSLARALRPREQPSPAVTLAAGIGLALGLADCGFSEFGLKWPNDLVTFEDAKLGGVLVEARAGSPVGPAPAMVVGVGLNLVGAQALGLERAVADLAALPGPGGLSALELLPPILARIVLAWEEFHGGGLDRITEDFAALDRLRGREVEILETGLKGKALGIDPGDGALLIQDGDGIRRLYSGDVSVRAVADG